MFVGAARHRRPSILSPLAPKVTILDRARNDPLEKDFVIDDLRGLRVTSMRLSTRPRPTG